MRRIRGLMDSGTAHDAALWATLAEAGVLGSLTNIVQGGRDWTDTAFVLDQCGYGLAAGALLSTVAIGAPLIAGGDPAIGRPLLAGIAAGSILVALAVAEDDGVWSAEAIEATAEALADPAGQGSGACRWNLSGRKNFVVDGAIADVILVAARNEDGVAMYIVDAMATGVDRHPLVTVDQTRSQAVVELDSTPARLLAGVPVETVVDLAAVALAMEAVGGARRCLEMAVAHARQRVQFGQPIGTFQAVAHRCAEMLVDLECARVAAFKAADAASATVAALAYSSGGGVTSVSASDRGAIGDPGAPSDQGGAFSRDRLDLGLAGPMAKVAATVAFAQSAAANIQIHGGQGFTWENDAHLYFKRARSSQLLFGDPRFHRELLATRLGW